MKEWTTSVLNQTIPISLQAKDKTYSAQNIENEDEEEIEETDDGNADDYRNETLAESLDGDVGDFDDEYVKEDKESKLGVVQFQPANLRPADPELLKLSDAQFLQHKLQTLTEQLQILTNQIANKTFQSQGTKNSTSKTCTRYKREGAITSRYNATNVWSHMNDASPEDVTLVTQMTLSRIRVSSFCILDFQQIATRNQIHVRADTATATVYSHESPDTTVENLAVLLLKTLAVVAGHWTGPINAAVYVTKEELLTLPEILKNHSILLTRRNVQMHVVVEHGVSDTQATSSQFCDRTFEEDHFWQA